MTTEDDPKKDDEERVTEWEDSKPTQEATIDVEWIDSKPTESGSSQILRRGSCHRDHR